MSLGVIMRLGEKWTSGSQSKTGRWWQLKGRIPPKSSLGSHWVYQGCLKGHDWYIGSCVTKKLHPSMDDGLTQAASLGLPTHLSGGSASCPLLQLLLPVLLPWRNGPVNCVSHEDFLYLQKWPSEPYKSCRLSESSSVSGEIVTHSSRKYFIPILPIILHC